MESSNLLDHSVIQAEMLIIMLVAMLYFIV